MNRKYIRKEDNIKANLTEVKNRDGSKHYLISWETTAIDRKEYKTLKGAENFLKNKGYEEQ